MFVGTAGCPHYHPIVVCFWYRNGRNSFIKRFLAVLRHQYGFGTCPQELWRGVVLSRPGAPAQPWHRDCGQLFEESDLANLPAHAITIFVPLVEITSEMGRTSFVPESHRSRRANDFTDFANSHFTPVLPFGSWLAFDNRIVHRGEANDAADGRDRPMLYFVYGKPWYQDVNNFPSDRPLYRSLDTAGGRVSRKSDLFMLTNTPASSVKVLAPPKGNRPIRQFYWVRVLLTNSLQQARSKSVGCSVRRAAES